jgi:amino acid transporter
MKASSAQLRTPILDLLFGKPLSTDEERTERVGPAAGVAVFGLDALSSAAYGPEAALTILLPLGALGVRYIVPITAAIIVLLTIVYFSYRQTIAAYPSGGGSYIVASQNLGTFPGLLAASSLMIDYTLDCAVGISAGVGALVSAAPVLQPHTLGLCLGILLLLTLINLRGVREAGGVFMLPTYVFVVCLLAVIGIGVLRTLLSGGHPAPIVAPPRPVTMPGASISLWLFLKAFSSGCTAMTGVEAVSNGVQAFRDPAVHTARRTLTLIVATLIVLLAGVGYLTRAYQIAATPPGQPGYQSVLSMITQSVVGRGIFYYVTMASILVVLALSANTAFADFPRLCRSVAKDCYLPYPLTLQGRRFVYTHGTVTLVFLTAPLLIIFRGITDALIPLFAVGTFLAFTLSQAGMVQHWRRVGGRGAKASMLINGVGALATGTALAVIIAAKFTEGAWVTVLLIAALIMLMMAIRRHYRQLARETANPAPLALDGIKPPLVVLPIQHWSKISEKALRFAYTLSHEIEGLHIDTEKGATHGLRQVWPQKVEKPALEAGVTPPRLVVLRSPYRMVLKPIFDHILQIEEQNPDRQIAVVVPELVEPRWYYFFLHNQRANALRAMLQMWGSRRIVVISVPWYLREWREEQAEGPKARAA